MTVTHQQQLAVFLGSKLVSYNVCLSKVLGSINASIFLNQLLYWSGKSRDPDWIYKKVDELQEETGLTSDQQLCAQKMLVSLGIIEVRRKGMSRIRHFKINEKRLYEVCSEYLGKHGKAVNQLAEIPTNE